MPRSWRLLLSATLGTLALLGVLACTGADASAPPIAAQRAEVRAEEARALAENEAAVRALVDEQTARRSAAETDVATLLASQLEEDRAAADAAAQAAAEQAAAEQAAAEQAAADLAAAEQAAADAAAAAAKPAAGGQATTPASPAPAGPTRPVPACVNDSTYAGPPFYTSPPGPSGDGSNGNIPDSAMTRLTWGFDTVGTPQYLTHRAASALDRLHAAYRTTFGEELHLDLTYRSYDEQVRMREALGTIAAVPGTSTHGTGRALDLPEWSCYAFGSARYQWLVENAPNYGWVAPSWARQNGSNPEYWHFEYTG